jgi:hypothetical protein
MGIARHGGHIQPVRRRPEVAAYEGQWIASIDSEIVAAALTSGALAYELQKMTDQRRAKAVVEFIRPTTDAYIVGAG